MIIKQDPISKLWCRSDGAILMPPSGKRFKAFRWTFGYKRPNGYKQIVFHSRDYYAHILICRAFHGLAPTDKPCVDHINRIKDDNRLENLHWVSSKENSDNQSKVEQSIAKYKVRQCENRRAYRRAYYESHREEYRAYRAAHREKYRAYARAYRERHK